MQVHDSIIVPMDVVKQRLQLGCYRNAIDCVQQVSRTEGAGAFFRSLPSTLYVHVYLSMHACKHAHTHACARGTHANTRAQAGRHACVHCRIMECPFYAVLVATNESLKITMKLESHGVSVGWQFLSAGISGVVASAVTQPLDVIKTRLQTQDILRTHYLEGTVKYEGLVSTAGVMLQEEGYRSFFRGTAPRMLFAAPSAAMCWGTYEAVKRLLTNV